MSERKRGFLRPGKDNDVAEAKRWGLPDYGQDVATGAKETALNYDPGWIPEKNSPVDEGPAELTEEEIELIRQGAYQEGLLQGQEAGFKQGFEKGKAEGIEAGHAEGFAQGQSEGLEAGQDTIREHTEHFIDLANQFAQPLALMNSQVERQLVDMVLGLVREVVHVEVQINPQIILDTIKACVESLPIAGHEITLKLNPEDVAIIRDAYGDEALELRQWQLVSEPSLSRGDVEIEAGESGVTYRMEERLRTVLQNFSGKNRHGGDAC
ncbi:Flagellar assembly protein FliH [Vibrio aerogenes CECT 7868]|uniref:Flagellar assembly protein FliH n=1 Tax=Vibrio aerogenes CECT 7868 TaxID=1216006 RepID=A0A1M5W7B2_9VIBR|nr:flagellar assembly protein FliH [Vibrio aerogenes]SHH83083.1 Flagellar assembly protein FliH [Vibrio aerogenes CECT 7868]